MDGTEDRNGDGFRAGNDPTDADSDWGDGQGLGETDAAEFDTDGDGLSDGLEFGLTAWETPDTDPAVFAGDTDAYATDPLTPDTDGDLLGDGLEDADGDGGVDATETDPRNADTDDDTLPDGTEDADRDGLVDSGETDPREWDTEGDGMPDGWEVENALLPLTDDAAGHADGDGLTNLEEFLAGTDPRDADSDRDLFPDGADLAPTTYSIKNEPSGPFLLASADVAVAVPLVAGGRDLVVSVALDYATPSSTLPLVQASGVADGNLNAVIAKVRVTTVYHLGYTAVVKVGYHPGQLPGGAEENDLLAYYYDGEADHDGDGDDEPYWTLSLRGSFGEETSRDPANHYVWARTQMLGDIAIADTTQNDMDGDGASDGEEVGVAAFDPPITELCPGEGGPYGSEPPNPASCDATSSPAWLLVSDYVEGRQATLYAKIWTEEGALERVSLEPDASSLWIEGVEHTTDQPFASMPVTNACVPAVEGPRLLAQEFRTHDGDFPSLGRVEILAYRSTTTPEAPLRVAIQEDGGTVPGASELGHGTIDSSLVSDAAPARVGVDFIGLDLLPDTQYWVVLGCAACSAGEYYWDIQIEEGSGGGWYLGGDSASTADSGAHWDATADVDYPFWAYERSYPRDPWLNILTTPDPGEDAVREWTPSGFVSTDQEVAAFGGGVNDFLGRFQSTCDLGGCSAQEGWVFLPFRFSLSSIGGLSVHALAFEVGTEAHPEEAFRTDTDGDGLIDIVEVAYYHSSPTSLHSDSDSIPDGEEVRLYGTDPTESDTEGDGLDDDEELFTYHSDPRLMDTDGDGLNDRWETRAIAGAPFFDGTVLHAGTRDNPLDADGDGLWNGPGDPDSDGDGLRDDIEANTNWDVRRDLNSDGDTDDPDEVLGGFVRSRPWLAHSDPDSLLDNEEWGDGTSPTSPLLADTDEDGLEDDDEGAGYTEVNQACVFWDLVYGKVLYNVGGKTYTVTHGGTTDSFPAGDRSVLYYDGSAFDTFQDWVIDGSPGTDGDYTMVNVGARGGTAVSGSLTVLQWINWNDGGTWGVTIALQVYAKASPLIADTDGDGLRDGWEVHGVPGVPLQDYGANPVMRDIFIEVDHMGSGGFLDGPHILSRDAQARMKRAFAQQGMALHIDDYEDYDDSGMMGGSEIGHDVFLNAYGEVHGLSGHAYFDRLWPDPAFFDPNRMGVFHYAIMAHQIWDIYRGNSDNGGLAPSRPSNRFAVASANAGDGDGSGHAFMHELGHNLGLPYKEEWVDVRLGPEYKSVMNYDLSYSIYDYFTGWFHDPLNGNLLTYVDEWGFADLGGM